MRPTFRIPAALAAALVFTAHFSCDDDPGGGEMEPVRARVLALGDSYTAGTGVAEGKSWPRQLSDALVADRVIVTELAVFARTGWSTTDLLDTLATDAAPPAHDFVTLQIGVNNVFGGLPFSVFETEFPLLVERAIALAGGDRERVLVLSVPDYSVTPVGSQIDPEGVRAEIDGYNGVVRAVTEEMGVASVDVTGLSRLALDDPTLIARDGLHFSPRMYEMWVDVVRPLVVGALKRRPFTPAR